MARHRPPPPRRGGLRSLDWENRRVLIAYGVEKFQSLPRGLFVRVTQHRVFREAVYTRWYYFGNKDNNLGIRVSPLGCTRK